MRVVHVCPTDSQGGAARGAYSLHTALNGIGITSIMLVLRKYSNDPSVIAPGGYIGRISAGLGDQLDHLPLKLYRRNLDSWWTIGWLPYDVRGMIDRLAPDLVHFHAVGRGAAPIETIPRLRHYPLVWTLRDLWALTGGCHYTAGCERYLSGCGACPQLGSRRERDISRWHWNRKHRAWSGARMTFVGLSRWVAECARRSPLTFGNEVTVIPNGIDTARFAPADRKVARAAWNLSGDRRIILFGALHSTTDPRKGYGHLRDAVQALARQGQYDDATIVVFGNDAEAPPLALETRYLGPVKDDAALALLYAAADVMVVPSTEESFGKTAAEAMACGVPVVGFADTGLADIIDHRVSGYLARHASAGDLAEGIAWTLDRVTQGSAIGGRAREKIISRFDTRAVAQRYARLYEQAIARHRTSNESLASAEP